MMMHAPVRRVMMRAGGGAVGHGGPRPRGAQKAGAARRARCDAVTTAGGPAAPTEAQGAPYPLAELSAEEIARAASAVRAHLGADDARFSFVTLLEPPKAQLAAFLAGDAPAPPRNAEVVATAGGEAVRCVVTLSKDDASVTSAAPLPANAQPLFSPDDCFLAEDIAKADDAVRKLLTDEYGIEDVDAQVACDPWSVHVPVSMDDYAPLADAKKADNQYSHPIDAVPVVDLISKTVVAIDKPERPVGTPRPFVPKARVNYHRDKVGTNDYLPSSFRTGSAAPAALDVVQPDGPSFVVHDTNVVEWQKWRFRVGFNYREGLVLHEVSFDGRPVVNRASLVEMAVPYGDPFFVHARKCAFDVGDYGLGYCTDSLALGCDCLGHIHYFDATLADSTGTPYDVANAVCMHEVDDGLLWKHVDYRTGHDESRRSRTLVLSSIATVVNYEYLFYWHFKQDGSLSLEIRLSGELSTNQASPQEATNAPPSGVTFEENKNHVPEYGTFVAPGVNAQIHQHMFSVRLDMDVDGGHANTVTEVDVETVPPDPETNPYGNAFRAVGTPLATEMEARRTCDPFKSRSWKISSGSKVNPLTGHPTAYRLLPYTIGPMTSPTLLTHSSSQVNARGRFAEHSLWVTKHSDDERFPAGEYTVQSAGECGGIEEWAAKDRPILNEDVVLWHTFGVCHMPRVEDFPVMPCARTGFTLEPDGFCLGNPAVDLAPEKNAASKLNSNGADGTCCSP